jgi:hypothetical protein
MQMAIICASAPAMKGFSSGIAQTVSGRYGSRTKNTDRSNSFPLASSKNSPGIGSGTRDLLHREGHVRRPENVYSQEHLRCEEHLYSEEHSYHDKWTESDMEPWNSGKTSHEMLTVPGKRARVQDGGILITETFSVDQRSDPYAKERRILGI